MNWLGIVKQFTTMVQFKGHPGPWPQPGFSDNLILFLLSDLAYLLTTSSLKKMCQRYFLNNSAKHWPTVIIFGMQHHKET